MFSADIILKSGDMEVPGSIPNVRKRNPDHGARGPIEVVDPLDDVSGQIQEKLRISDQGDGKAGGLPGDEATCVLVLGMAGSGKTTFVTKLSEYLTERGTPPYLVNLDPAVRCTPYPVNIDIRDTVNYKAVMKKFGLGPNGGIMTSLNLFTTKFSGVLELLEKRKERAKYMLFDTPGQIEVFTWSASGTIITETLADIFPTVVVYVMDVSTSTSPITFMSNMLYACSIMYKSKLPFVIALNKIDLADPRFAVNWMKDFEAFDIAVDQETTYAAGLSRSLGLILDEFYNVITSVPVCALTGQGFGELVEALTAAKNEYTNDYKPNLEKLKKEQLELRERKKIDRLEKLKREVGEVSSGSSQIGSGYSKGAISVGVFNESEKEPDNRDMDEEEERREAASFDRFIQSTKNLKTGNLKDVQKQSC